MKRRKGGREVGREREGGKKEGTKGGRKVLNCS